MTVQLWARSGAGDALAAYEDKVLALLGDHEGRLPATAACPYLGAGDGRLLQPARTVGAGDGPDEIQLIEFASQAGYEGFAADPRRTSSAAEREAAIARADLDRVDLVDQRPPPAPSAATP